MLDKDEILENADSPDSENVKSTIRSNTDAIVSNYGFYLNLLDSEKAFSTDGLNEIARGISTYFPKLIQTYPDADYSELLQKIEHMEKRSKTQEIKSALAGVKGLLPHAEESTETA